MAEPTSIGNHPSAKASYVHVRVDVQRDTRLSVGCNLSGHPHVTIGDEATLILHPHAAERLVADLRAVLDGAEFAAK